MSLFNSKTLSCHALAKKLNFTLYRTVILPVVLYVCETCFLILREHKLQASENRSLQKIL